MFFRTRAQEGTISTTEDANNTSIPYDNAPPPSYTELANDIHNFTLGDPRERISVPMVHTSSQRGRTVQTVVVRKLTREYVPSQQSLCTDMRFSDM